MDLSQTIQSIDLYLRQVTPFGFAGAVLIAKDGEILLNQGYGMANRAAQTPNTADTIFSLGSITKQFTASAILKLEMQGLLATGDHLSRFLSVPADKTAITLHHLLSHTSGLQETDYLDFDVVERDRIIAEILALPLKFTPGEMYSYSNTGYTLLAAVVEFVSGKSYETFLRETFFLPAGMTETGYRLPDWDHSRIAHWYHDDVDQGISTDKYFPSWVIVGCGEVLSTTRDMLRWHQALMGDALLSAEAKQKMYRPNLSDYGYGWRIEETPQGKLIQHGGASDLGSSAQFDRFVDTGWVTMLFCNQNYPGAPSLAKMMRAKIHALLFSSGDSQPYAIPDEVQPAAPEHLRAYEGIYQQPGGEASLRVWVEQQGLKISAAGQLAINALAIPNTYNKAIFDPILRRTREIFLSAIQGDFAPIEATGMEPGKPRPALRRVVSTNAAEVEANEVITDAVLPSSFAPGYLDCFLRLSGPKGSAPLVFIWKDETTSYGLTQVAFETEKLVVIPFYQQSGETFLGCHLASGHLARAQFSMDAGGTAASVVIQPEGGEAVRFVRAG